MHKQILAATMVTPQRIRSFIFFIIIGGIGLGIALSCTYVLTSYMHLWYFFSFLIGTFLAWTFVFFMNAIFTFKARHAITVRKYFSFMGGYLAVFWINAGIVYLATSVIAIPYEISIVIGAIASMLVNFIFSSSVIFTKK